MFTTSRKIARRKRLNSLAVTLMLASALLNAACSGSGIVDVRMGSLELKTQTLGANADSDGYQVRIAGAEFDATRPIGSNDMLVHSVVSERTYTVTLSGVAANCSVDPGSRAVQVPMNGSVALEFQVSCS